MGDGGKRRLTIISISSLILVAMVVAVTIGVSQNASDQSTANRQEVVTSVKAIQNICEPTDYKEVCVDSLTASSAGNTTDPRELIRAAFLVAKEKIQEAAQNSSLLQELSNDPRTKEALANCRDLAESAVADLGRSFNDIKQIDASSFDEEYLQTGMQLTSNGLAMVTEISNALSQLNIQGFNSRRLLSNELHIVRHGEFPRWISAGTRKLLAKKSKKIKPDLIVAKDGTGKYKTINEALEDIPEDSNKTFVLYIKAGVYEEKVQFNRSMTHLMVVGDGPTKTRITGKLNFIDGTSTFHTATVAVLGDYFIAKDIGFENSAGPDKHQAVALRVGADMSVFYNCHMDAYQDTLYVHTYRQFYRDCVISGTIDFVFGDSASVFQGCTFIVRKPLDNQANIVTAQGRKESRQPTGIVLQNCTITAAPEYYPVRNTLKSYLGRPWKEHSRTIIMESYIDDLIQPDGWLPWNGTFALDTCFYTEYNNRGPAASTLNRTQWKGVKELTKARVEHFTADHFILGSTWVPATGVPYTPGLIFPSPPDTPKAIESEKEADKSEKKIYRNKSDYEAKKEDDDKKTHHHSDHIALPPVSTASPSPAPVVPPVPQTAAPAPSPIVPHKKKSKKRSIFALFS
ncbi:hypothetical protein C3L33_19909, partial [Rhododendron williamsianum]